MRITQLHEWQVSIPEAKAIQERLRSQVRISDEFDHIDRVAGVDVGFDKTRGRTRAAVVVLALEDLSLIDHAEASLPTRFPYVPGYLSFREVPAICKALEALRVEPDLICCDGQGYAHPRRLGVACHLGLLTDLPCLGVGKSRLIGTHDAVPIERGRWCSLEDAGETVGAVLRTRARVKPVFVSAGHKISLESRYPFSCRV